MSQKDSNVSRSIIGDINKIGSAKILRVLQMPDNSTIIIQGKKGLKLKSISKAISYMFYSELKEINPSVDNKKFIATIDSLRFSIKS